MDELVKRASECDLSVDSSHTDRCISDTEEARRRSVSFDALHIRVYGLILGDHPCCTAGPPLSLGWDVVSNHRISVDEYEAGRKRRRSRTQMRLRVDERRHLLKGESAVDLRRAERKAQRERNSGTRNARAFFSPIEPNCGTMPHSS